MTYSLFESTITSIGGMFGTAHCRTVLKDCPVIQDTSTTALHHRPFATPETPRETLQAELVSHPFWSLLSLRCSGASQLLNTSYCTQFSAPKKNPYIYYYFPLFINRRCSGCS